MGDSRRFHLFSSLASEVLDRDMRIADVSAGMGYMQRALREKGFKYVESWDKRKKRIRDKGLAYRYGYFGYDCKKKYDAVVAMHPDEGTDHAILYAGINKVPAIVCPCCVKWDAVVYHGPNKFNMWAEHLESLANKHRLSIQKTKLKMRGRNLVYIFKPVW